jgi:hypothetical protein
VPVLCYKNIHSQGGRAVCVCVFVFPKCTLSLIGEEIIFQNGLHSFVLKKQSILVSIMFKAIIREPEKPGKILKKYL